MDLYENASRQVSQRGTKLGGIPYCCRLADHPAAEAQHPFTLLKKSESFSPFKYSFGTFIFWSNLQIQRRVGKQALVDKMVTRPSVSSSAMRYPQASLPGPAHRDESTISGRAARGI